MVNLAGNQEANVENAQGGQPLANPTNWLVPTIPVRIPPITIEVKPVVVGKYKGNPYSLEKFIENEPMVIKGTTHLEKNGAWTLNMLKSFRVMAVQEAHWVRLASCMFEDDAIFW